MVRRVSLARSIYHKYARLGELWRPGWPPTTHTPMAWSSSGLFAPLWVCWTPQPMTTLQLGWPDPEVSFHLQHKCTVHHRIFYLSLLCLYARHKFMLEIIYETVKPHDTTHGEITTTFQTTLENAFCRSWNKTGERQKIWTVGSTTSYSLLVIRYGRSL